MLERFLHHVRVERPVATETAAEARERLRDRFPRGSVRRMTHLGMLVGSALEGAPLGAGDAVVYASTFAETRALEDFLGSFPAASPMLFQTSIHPSAVQQALIARQQPVARLWPVASRARLVEDALRIALLEPAACVAIAGGEERGTWMLENAMASAEAYAFAVTLRRERDGAVGRLACEPEEGADEPCPELAALAAALEQRRPLGWRGGGARWSVSWR